MFSRALLLYIKFPEMPTFSSYNVANPGEPCRRSPPRLRLFYPSILTLYPPSSSSLPYSRAFFDKRISHQVEGDSLGEVSAACPLNLPHHAPGALPSPFPCPSLPPTTSTPSPLTFLHRTSQLSYPHFSPQIFPK